MFMMHTPPELVLQEVAESYVHIPSVNAREGSLSPLTARSQLQAICVVHHVLDNGYHVSPKTIGSIHNVGPSKVAMRDFCFAEIVEYPIQLSLCVYEWHGTSQHEAEDLP